MTTHDLKCWPEYFQSCSDGLKTYELRKDDRPYEINDWLLLREWSPAKSDYTGREFSARITHILRNAEQFGLMPGYCILSLE